MHIPLILIHSFACLSGTEYGIAHLIINWSFCIFMSMSFQSTRFWKLTDATLSLFTLLIQATEINSPILVNELICLNGTKPSKESREREERDERRDREREREREEESRRGEREMRTRERREKMMIQRGRTREREETVWVFVTSNSYYSLKWQFEMWLTVWHTWVAMVTENKTETDSFE